MALPKFTLYKYVRTERGWRYCRACFYTNGKIVPDAVLVNNKQEKHAEGRYCMAHCGNWIDAGIDALEAQRQRARHLAQSEYERLGGRVQQTPEPARATIRSAIDSYLAEVDLQVRSKNRRQGTYNLMKTTLENFFQHSNRTYLHEIKACHLDSFAACVIQKSPTRSSQTGRNEWLRVNQFLHAQGIVLMIREAQREVPLGMKHAPKVTQGIKVITNTDEEVELPPTLSIIEGLASILDR